MLILVTLDKALIIYYLQSSLEGGQKAVVDDRRQLHSALSLLSCISKWSAQHSEVFKIALQSNAKLFGTFFWVVIFAFIGWKKCFFSSNDTSYKLCMHSRRGDFIGLGFAADKTFSEKALDFIGKNAQKVAKINVNILLCSN